MLGMSVAAWSWLIVIVVALGVQLIVDTIDGLLVAVAAALAFLLAAFVPGVPLWVQLVVFAVVLLGALLLGRNTLLRRLQPGAGVATNVERLVGRRAIVTVAIDDDAQRGEIQLLGERWQARTSPEGGGRIAAETAVRIVAIEGVTAMVEPWDAPPAP